MLVIIKGFKSLNHHHKYLEVLGLEKNKRLQILKNGVEIWLNANDLKSFEIKNKKGLLSKLFKLKHESEV